MKLFYLGIISLIVLSCGVNHHSKLRFVNLKSQKKTEKQIYINESQSSTTISTSEDVKATIEPNFNNTYKNEVEANSSEQLTFSLNDSDNRLLERPNSSNHQLIELNDLGFNNSLPPMEIETPYSLDRKKEEVSNTEKMPPNKIAGWTLIGLALGMNLIALLFLDALEFGIAAFWIIGVILLIIGLILLLVKSKEKPKKERKKSLKAAWIWLIIGGSILALSLLLFAGGIDAGLYIAFLAAGPAILVSTIYFIISIFR